MIDSFFGQTEVAYHASKIDWSNHPLGPVEKWDTHLKIALGIAFNSKFPMFVSWGKERFFFYNDAYAVILHKRHPAAFGARFEEIWSDIWEDILPLIEAVDQGRSIYLENLKLNMTRKGYEETAYFTFSYSPIQDENKNVLGLFCAVHETTNQILAEEENKIAKQTLQEAINTRDEFMSIASHELKTPLTSLKLNVNLMKRMVDKGDYTPKRISQFSEQTDRQIQRLERLINDMLDISRIRTGKLVINREYFNLYDVAVEVLGRMASQFTSAGMKVPTIEGDRDISGNWDMMRIEQVIINLLSNSIRYGEKKDVHIKISKLDGMAELRVQDSGIGISDQNQRTMFQIFQRFSHLNESSGLGLGLFLSKQIISAHDGEIRVESEPGKGSTFIITLPIIGYDGQKS